MSFNRLGKRDILKLGAPVKKGSPSAVQGGGGGGGGNTGQPTGLLLLITQA